jgi:hypothetical protein
VRIVEGISLHLMNTETRIAAAACVPGVGRRCYRFTRPGQMKTPPPTWTGLSLSETYALKYWWCSPPRTGIASVRPTVWTARGTGASFCNDRCVRASL